MQSNKKRVAKNAGFFIVLILLIVFFFCNSSNGLMTKVERDFFGQQSQYVDEIQERFHISDEPSVLYLDAGVAPYYLQANSSGRYICPLPFQRDSPEWNLTGNKAFQQTYSDIMAYDGEYIVGDGAVGVTDWIHSTYPSRAAVVRKLDTEYDLVWDNGWTIYKKK